MAAVPSISGDCLMGFVSHSMCGITGPVVPATTQPTPLLLLQIAILQVPVSIAGDLAEGFSLKLIVSEQAQK